MASFEGFLSAIGTGLRNFHSIAFPKLLVIFNHENFNDSSLRRFESASDVLSLHKLFTTLRYTVEIKNDQTLDDITHEVYKLSHMDFDKYKCLVIVVLTHGTECGTLRAFDTEYSFQKTIVDKIVQNNTLKGVPKIFLVNAAVGRIRPKNNRGENSANYNNDYRSSALEADVIKIYNNYIFRNRHLSINDNFIKKFCEIITEDDCKNINAILLECRRFLVASSSNYLPIETTTMTDNFSFVYGKDSE